MNDLILADQQLQLFDSSQMDDAFFAAEESKHPPSFTGARLLKFRPDSYKRIVQYSAEGTSAVDIAKMEGVSDNTVYAVRRNNHQNIEAIRLQLAGLSFEAALACGEGVLEARSDPERWKKMTLKDMALSFGIMIDKGQLLSGSPTARLQTMSRDPPDYEECLQILQEGFERRNERRKKTFSIGLGEGKENQRAIGPAGAADQGEGRGPGMYEDAAVIEGELVPAEEVVDPSKGPDGVAWGQLASGETYPKMGGHEDLDQPEIVKPWASGEGKSVRIEAEVCESERISADQAA